MVITSVSEKLVEIYNSLKETKAFLVGYVEGVIDGEDESLKNDPNVKIVESFSNKKIDDCISFLVENSDLFNDMELLKILNNDVLGFRSSVLQLKYQSSEEFSILLKRIIEFLESFRSVQIGVIALRNANTIINNELKPKIEEVKEKVKDFDSLRLALEQRETSTIYLELHDKYKEEYSINNRFFFYTLLIATVVTILSAIQWNYNFSDQFSYNPWVIFITIKVLIATLAITLCTLFLRRSAHAKKLSDQAYQTHVEINAFPIHVRSLKNEDKHELIKELAMKYFGKELDQTQNDKIGDLMKEQLTAGTELIKASAELVKAKGSSTPPP